MRRTGMVCSVLVLVVLVVGDSAWACRFFHRLRRCCAPRECVSCVEVTPPSCSSQAPSKDVTKPADTSPSDQSIVKPQETPAEAPKETPVAPPAPPVTPPAGATP
ncbi:MAG: hypothetical protein ACYC0Y_23980, partial [Pirellulales bacterium]